MKFQIFIRTDKPKLKKLVDSLGEEIHPCDLKAIHDITNHEDFPNAPIFGYTFCMKDSYRWHRLKEDKRYVERVFNSE